MLDFKITKTSGKARRGELKTAHGTVQTPAFMPVGTAATVKAMLPESVASTGAQIILGNTYHLMLRPGAQRIAQLGGLHRFMGWYGPILTDSGGFQVMSLSQLRKISEEGVSFASHIDGKRYMLSPERSIEIQYLLDSDITMAFDECMPYPSPRKAVEKSMERSMRWASRSKNAFKNRDGYGIFGINQGGMHPDLRAVSAEALTKIGFDGYAIGGLAVGEGQEMMFQMLDDIPGMLPENKPRYLMGVGRPSDIVGAVLRGVDMFDCVMPTRSGRTALAFTREGTLNLRNAVHQKDSSPLDAHCSCPACTNYSRAYLHHLFRTGEILGCMLLTWHNIQYYQDLMRSIRTAVEKDKYEDFAADFFEKQKTAKRPL